MLKDERKLIVQKKRTGKTKKIKEWAEE